MQRAVVLTTIPAMSFFLSLLLQVLQFPGFSHTAHIPSFLPGTGESSFAEAQAMDALASLAFTNKQLSGNSTFSIVFGWSKSIAVTPTQSSSPKMAMYTVVDKVKMAGHSPENPKLFGYHINLSH
jgi:hypothetical protein